MNSNYQEGADFSNVNQFKELIQKYEAETNIIQHPSFSTKTIHVAQEPEQVHGSVTTPIHLTSTFAQKVPGDLIGKFDYARCGNPTRQVLEDVIASLEYGKYGMVFSSGCAAMTCVILSFSAGDHFIVCDDVYGGTQRYIRQIAVKNHKFEADFVDMTDPVNVEKAIKPNTKLIWIETPTNPTLKICDIKAICDIAKKHNIIVVSDNTFATPYLQSPMLLGSDIVINSATKYIGGHADLVMGTITVNTKELYDRLYFVSKSFGGCPSPFDCYLALRGLKTLKLRMEAHCKSAGVIANYLENHPDVEKVIYPGLKSHPQHELAKKQMRGFGGMITFYLKGGTPEVNKFARAIHVFTCAESLGGVESLMEIPSLMTHASVPAEHRKLLGIEDNMIRLSIGVEDVEDLLQDLDTGLKAIHKQEN